MKISLPVTWEVYSRVVVEADSIEEAVSNFEELTEFLPLPTDPDYVDGSFQLSSDIFEENCEMAEII